MRRLWMLLCILLGVLCIVMQRPEADPAPLTVSTEEAAVQPDCICVEYVRPSTTPEEAAEPITIGVYENGSLNTVEMEEYLIHVVAGEMPASYEFEALCAQAVAARTYVAWKMPIYGGSGCSRGGDVCTDSKHCMAYMSEPEMQTAWGEHYAQYYDKIAQAVQATEGAVMTYRHQPIQALFHSSSGGQTEDAQAVWGTAFPYLKSVESSGEEDTRKVKRYTAKQLVEQLNTAIPDAQLTTKTVKTQFVVRTRTDSGRADAVRVGKVTASGKAVRAALGLNSAQFTIEWEGDEAVITTVGHGHGVGMSQVGANAMAAAGCGYREILLHYYTGAEIEQIQMLGA